MIYQLPNGRIIEMTLEQYLDMTDEELKDLNGLDNSYSSEVKNPFYKSCLQKSVKEKAEIPQEREPNLDEIKDIEKMEDDYFHRDDV